MRHLVALLLLVKLLGSCDQNQNPASSIATEQAPPSSSYRIATYESLADTGLYADIETRELADGVIVFEPRFQLYSDGLVKTRWLKLPEQTKIAATDLDRWQFPVGTKVFKEFAVQAANGLFRVETRLLEKQSDHWSFASYVWNSEQTAAQRWLGEDGSTAITVTIPENASELRQHTVPSIGQCILCHDQRSQNSELPDYEPFLGLTTFQLRRSTLTSWMQEDRLDEYDVPGQRHRTYARNTTERDVFGYLHANCGSCHNPRRTDLIPAGDGTFHLSYDLEHTTGRNETPVIQQIGRPVINRNIGLPQLPADAKLIFPGSLDKSVVYLRMITVPAQHRMPLVGVQSADAAFVRQRLRSWILGL